MNFKTLRRATSIVNLVYNDL